ncbi:hypothetical protein SBA3_990004 [Candidatus Sulfopaludibacter sp. SbA3]|nr:hypothetical protein SBA3_990004 [Candidatus Sulfopaludibacter sp. SbA3]
MIFYTIHIELDPPGLVPTGGSFGNIVYRPALLRVQAGDMVRWTCQHPFVVVFKDQTPFEAVEINSQLISGVSETGSYTIQNVKGQFHYAVAIWNGTNVFADVACPRISVN